MKSTKNVVVAVLLTLVIVVALQNTEAVETRVLLVTFSMPRALLLFLTLLTGVVIGLVVRIRKPGSEKQEG